MLRTLLLLILTAPLLARPQGHSHNDYHQPYPLTTALQAHMGSVEADVFLRDGQLLLGHSARELSPERSLRRLYLEPLRKHVGCLQLLVDIKGEAQPTVDALELLLQEYADILGPDKVTVVLTGNRPRSTRLALDATVDEMESGHLPAGARMVSGQWSKSVEPRLRALADQAHAAGLPIRFWGGPDGPESWQLQCDSGVDWINTDQPARLQTFLRRQGR